MSIGRWQAQHEDLQQRLLDAHARQNLEALVPLYTECADLAEVQKDISAARFYLTHALVYALDGGLSEYEEIRRRLEDHGGL